MSRPQLPRARSWRSLTVRLRAPSMPRGRQTAPAACFGTLPAKEEMVVKGLAASLRCSPPNEDLYR
jgi:hypothetical protein